MGPSGGGLGDFTFLYVLEVAVQFLKEPTARGAGNGPGIPTDGFSAHIECTRENVVAR